MATNTNNNGGASESPSPSLPMYYSEISDKPPAEEGREKMVPIVVVVIAVIILLLRPLWSNPRRSSSSGTEEHEAGGGGRARQPPRPPTVAGVELAPVRMAEPPLVCAYSKADTNWGESSCGVCLAELDDGEVVRVLPACMHYFHAACVGEWLRTHDTCPLCRAPLVVAPCIPYILT